jgi:hypothetical protein
MGDAGYANNVDIANVNNMRKFSHKCPFCNNDIPKIYNIKTVTKRKRHKTRIRTIKEIIGEDWATHVKTCTKLKEFLNNTKEEDTKP